MDENEYHNSNEFSQEEVMIRDYYLKKTYPPVDVHQELETFKKKQSSRKGKAMLVGSSFLAGAAAVILLFLLLHSQKLILFSSEENNTIVAFEADKENAGTITLSQAGQTIAVDKASQAQLAQRGLTLNEKDKKLIYGESAETKEKVVMQTLSVPRCKTFKVLLADGTEVWLNADSRLTYPNKFTGNQRIVQLQGEAYFKVAHNAKCPFIVKTNRLQTRVLGTEFNLRNYSAGDTHVTLLKGSVEVSTASCKVKIRPGQDAQFMANKYFHIREVDTEEYSMWKDGYFYFDNVPLVEIAQELGRWYNVGVVFNNKSDLGTRLFFVADRHSSINEAIEMLNSMKKVHIILKNNRMIVD